MIGKIFLPFIMVLGLTACFYKNYVEYRPHFMNKESREKSYGSPKLSSTEFKNTIQLLEYYGDEYKIKEGNIILITSELNKDWEMLWNYTTKANDVDWLKSHKPNKKQ